MDLVVRGTHWTAPTPWRVAKAGDVADEYWEDRREFLFEAQTRSMPGRLPLEEQNGMTWQHRSDAITFVLGVVWDRSYRADTFASAVSLLDRFLSKRVVPLTHLKATSLVCLYLAAKYEEVHYRLQLKDLSTYLEDKENFPADVLLQLELLVLDTLEYDLGSPTAETFLQLFFAERDDHINIELFVISRLLCEYGLWRGGRFTVQRPEDVAEAAILAGGRLLHHPPDVLPVPQAVRDLARILTREIGNIPPILLHRHAVERRVRAQGAYPTPPRDRN